MFMNFVGAYVILASADGKSYPFVLNVFAIPTPGIMAGFPPSGLIDSA